MKYLTATLGSVLLGSLTAIFGFSALSSGYGTAIGLGAPVSAMFVATPDGVGIKSGRPATTAPEVPEPISKQVEALQAGISQPAVAVANINALFATNSFIAAYGKEKQMFPNSNGRLVPARDMLKVLGSAELEKNVPAERFARMRYVSDGKSYKLIMVGTGDCAVVRALRPAMVDPQRSAGDLDCIAYGFWTPKGAAY